MRRKEMPENNGISLAELKAILAEQAKENAAALKSVIEEMKKPTILEQKVLDAQAQETADRQKERKENAAGIHTAEENKRAAQRACTHKHANGFSHCVLVTESQGPGYILCQLLQCKIRQGTAPKDYTGGDIFDSVLFARLLQEMPSSAVFQ
jgi:hypothetical protein